MLSGHCMCMYLIHSIVKSHEQMLKNQKRIIFIYV